MPLPTPTQIVDMILSELQAYLVAKLSTEVANDDPSKAHEVKTGMFQDDPTDQIVYVHLQPNDPTDLGNAWDHVVADPGEPNKLGMHVNYPTREVGVAGGLWWRRGVARFGIYYLDNNFAEQEAQTHAHKVLGRIEYHIDHCPTVIGLTDEFGEMTHTIQVVRSRMTAGGGDSSWIWRGITWWQVLASKNEAEI